ncbi:hypothetical protein [Aldersonia kunmingensis]|nr:hypothetical protein [Aldersonia kunmingensis]
MRALPSLYSFIADVPTSVNFLGALASTGSSTAYSGALPTFNY